MAMLQESIQYLKSKVEEFEPWWTWKIPTVKEKENHQRYQKIVSVCRTSQFCLAVLAILIIAAFERSRQLFIATALQKGFSRFLTDILIYAIIGYLLGLKRFPANFISLAIIQTFMQLEEEVFVPELYKFEVKVIGRSQKGLWSVVTASPDKVAPSALLSYAENAGLLLISLAGFRAFCKYSDFDVSKYNGTVLVSQTVASSCAALLLLTTFAFDEFPEFKETHRKFCERWIIFAVTTLVFVMAFLFERLQTKVRGKLKSSLSCRIEWDCFLYILTFSLAVRCIPMIHRGFNVKHVLSNKTPYILEALVPSLLMNVWHEIIEYVSLIWH